MVFRLHNVSAMNNRIHGVMVDYTQLELLIIRRQFCKKDNNLVLENEKYTAVNLIR